MPGFKGLVLFLFFLMAAGACTNETEMAALQAAEDANNSRDSIEDYFVETMNEINNNLDMIRQKQGIISFNNGEQISKKESILTNISLINSLIEDNRNKIEELTIQTRRLGKDKNALSRIVAQTRNRIQKQEEEIAGLKQQLEQESYKVADLNRRIEEMQLNNELLMSERSTLAEGNLRLDKDLNKAYFAYGTSEELQQKQLVEKKGGFLGVGKREALANAFYKNKSYFTELDMREVNNIPIHGKKPKLLTNHPENSYEWKTNPENEAYVQLMITDAEAFWSNSKFLIVEVKN